MLAERRGYGAPGAGEHTQTAPLSGGELPRTTVGEGGTESTGHLGRKETQTQEPRGTASWGEDRPAVTPGASWLQPAAG